MANEIKIFHSTLQFFLIIVLLALQYIVHIYRWNIRFCNDIRTF